MNDRTLPLSDPRAAELPVRNVAGAAGEGPPPLGAAERTLVIVGILSLVAMNIVGFIPAVILIASSLLLIALRWEDSLKTLVRFSPLLLLPVLASASTLWSDAPAQSLKAGLEVLMTVIAAILLCRNAPARTLILVMFAGLLPVCLTTLLWAPQALSTGLPMNAFFGSKNELGAMAQLLVALSLAIAMDGQRGLVLRWLAIGAALLGAGLLVLSQSSTAMVCAGVTAVVFPILVLFGRLPLAVRIGSVAAMFVAMGLALPFVATITSEIEDFRGTVLNKDSTLTGRTYLWDIAREVSAERPYFGHGYASFWRQGNLDAEALWRWAGVGRGGFNFHNAFVEIRVDLGMVGQALLIFSCAAILLLAITRQVWRPSVPMAFIVTFEAILYVRSYAETGLFAPFSFMTVFWVGGAVYAFSELSAARDKKQSATVIKPVMPRLGPTTVRVHGMPQPRRSGPSGRRV